MYVCISGTCHIKGSSSLYWTWEQKYQSRPVSIMSAILT